MRRTELALAFTLAVFLGAGPLGATAPPPACAITDLMPAFWTYWERAQGASPTEQFRLFEERVQQPNAAVYESAFSGAPKPPSEFVPPALEQVRALEPRMRELSVKLAADFPGELDAFRVAFPKFQCSVPVLAR